MTSRNRLKRGFAKVSSILKEGASLYTDIAGVRDRSHGTSPPDEQNTKEDEGLEDVYPAGWDMEAWREQVLYHQMNVAKDVWTGDEMYGLKRAKLMRLSKRLRPYGRGHSYHTPPVHGALAPSPNEGVVCFLSVGGREGARGAGFWNEISSPTH